jgi:hypothetical protein
MDTAEMEAWSLTTGGADEGEEAEAGGRGGEGRFRLGQWDKNLGM